MSIPPRAEVLERTAQRVYLVGYYGVGNLGDEMIRLAADAVAREAGVEIVAYAAWGPETDGDGRAVRIRRDPIRHLRTILSVDRVVIGGGGILKDEGRRMPFELLATALVARLARRPVGLLAVGVGPLRTRAGRWAIGATARLAHPRLVRDADSATTLRRLGVRGVAVAADPVFSLAPSSMPPGRAGEETTRGVPAADVLVAVRRWERTPGGWDRLARGLAEGLSRVVRPGGFVHFTDLYWPRDGEASREVSRYLAPGVDARIDDAPVTWDALVSLCASAGVVIAMRYHALVAAAMAGAPVVAVAYEPKVRALAEELGVPAVDPGAPDLGAQLAAAVAAAGPDVDPARVGRVASLRARARAGVLEALGAADDAAARGGTEPG